MSTMQGKDALKRLEEIIPGLKFKLGLALLGHQTTQWAQDESVCDG